MNIRLKTEIRCSDCLPKIEVPENFRLRCTKQILDKHGPEYLSRMGTMTKKLCCLQRPLCVTHNSHLIATRVRTVDMERIAPAVSAHWQ